MTPQLDGLRKALDVLFEAAALSGNDERMGELADIERVAIRAGVVKCFEVAYDLCCDFMARWLNANVTPGIADAFGRRQLFRFAAERELIRDFDRWIGHHEGRNAASHIHDFDTSGAACRATTDFVHDARALLGELAARND